MPFCSVSVICGSKVATGGPSYMKTSKQSILVLLLFAITLGTPRTQVDQPAVSAQSSPKRPVTIPVDITSLKPQLFSGIINLYYVLKKQIESDQSIDRSPELFLHHFETYHCSALICER